MKCPECNLDIPEGEEREHNGEYLCEDCYISVLSPARFCDPWAAYCAQSSLEIATEPALSAYQSQILMFLKNLGEIEASDLKEKLKDKIPAIDIEREWAALNRMGRISIKSKQRKTILSIK